MPAQKVPKIRSTQSSLLLRFLILSGIVILVTFVFLIKNEPQPPSDLTSQDPEAQLDWYLENQKPVFVFFHSTTCKTCTDMMAVVDQVYPQYQDQVGLVDVDVYDSWNQSLLNRARIMNIPTQVFINEKGEGTATIGGMQPDELRAALQALAEGTKRGN